MRKQFRGLLCLLRYQYDRRIGANIVTEDGDRFHYFPAPRGLVYAASGLTIAIPISFNANEDGSNPRAVKDLRCPWNQ